MQIQTQPAILSLTLKNISSISVALGFTILLYYCWMIGYFPVGLSFGDTVFVIFIAVGFSLIASIYLVFGLYVSWAILFVLKVVRRIFVSLIRCFPLSIRRCLRAFCRNGKGITLPPGRMFVAVLPLLVAAYVQLIIVKEGNSPNFFGDVLIFSLFYSFISLSWNGIRTGGLLSKANFKVEMWMLAFPLIFITFFLSSSKNKAIMDCMEVVGIMKRGAFVQLDEKHHKFIADVMGPIKANIGANVVIFPRVEGCKGKRQASSPVPNRVQEIPSNIEPIRVDVDYYGVGEDAVLNIDGCHFIVPKSSIMVAYGGRAS